MPLMDGRFIVARPYHDLCLRVVCFVPNDCHNLEQDVSPERLACNFEIEVVGPRAELHDARDREYPQDDPAADARQAVPGIRSLRLGAENLVITICTEWRIQKILCDGDPQMKPEASPICRTAYLNASHGVLFL